MSNYHPAEPHTHVDTWLPMNELFAQIPHPEACVIIDEKVELLHSLQAENTLAIEAGEEAKSFNSLRRATAFIDKRRLQGAKYVMAVGGGTVGDVVGLAAHLVKRGMPLVQVPSTLLASVDSSIGGKVAINSETSKNVFGAYHFADSCFLVEELWSTLESDQLLEGVAEVAKMALIDSPSSVDKLKTSTPTAEMVRIGRQIKTDVVNRDPFEKTGLRHVLNFGHTVGHTIESMSNYRVSHGLAVAMGMRAALDLGQKLKTTPDDVAFQANEFLDNLKMPTVSALKQVLRNRTWQEFFGQLANDKKGLLRFVLLRKIGEATVEEVDESIIRDLFEQWSV